MCSDMIPSAITYTKLCYARPSPDGEGVEILLVNTGGDIVKSSPLSLGQIANLEDALRDAYRNQSKAVG